MNLKESKIKTPTLIESIIIKTMIVIGVISILNFLYFFFKAEFRGYLPLYICLSIILIYGAMKKWYLWYHYFNISIPKKVLSNKSEISVDVLTTYFPGEPYEMTIETLTAIQAMEYPHTTYLCDEANDPYLIEECKRLGVIHITRNNRIDAKAGNINNALKSATGAICLILDPDHIPYPNFLKEIIPYFENEELGYVQVVQAYHNKHETLVARGAAEQTFQFYGPMMMTMNSYGTVNAIGANCVFRRSALDSIGGHAPGLAEDMHTAMKLHAKGWKSIYVPQLLAKGLAPADLTSYYKQQLKWSRGTFELLYKEYPKLFKHFTWRQKIHYALLPLHYLIGFIYLLNFLIPIVALFTSQMPWTGNILYFIFIISPVFMSSFLIRTYIQKWVIEKSERGFHVIGGLLQLITWWVFLLGVVYTFLRKKVPYLPTPKREDVENNLNIVVPNLVVGTVSIIAIIYGLYQDLTPFSIIMAMFALLNAIFMFFSLYLAMKATNRNRILRSRLAGQTIDRLKRIKKIFGNFIDKLFNLTRRLALILLISVVFLANIGLEKWEAYQWNQNIVTNWQDSDLKYLGIFLPSDTLGISDISDIIALEKKESLNFQLISFYLAWGDQPKNQLSKSYLKKIKDKGAIPMITWEPWGSTFAISDSILDYKYEKRILHYIADGNFDDYIKETALRIKGFDLPVFLRFGHEFDNPAYPWSTTGGNTAQDYKQAWQHIHELFEQLRVTNVQWVWNPWKTTHILDYYPGDYYVDWLGVTLLDYGAYNPNGKSFTFEQLYSPFHQKFKKIANKPILLTEFGSLNMNGNQKIWMQNAFNAIDTKYNKIGGLVFFNSFLDKNIPENNLIDKNLYLDWSFSAVGKKDFSFFRDNPIKIMPAKANTKKYTPIAPPDSIRGVGYSKGNDWSNNHYVANKRTLVADFKAMSALGINLIKYDHSTIYNHNVLKYAEQEGIKILYSFPSPNNIDFTKDTVKLDELKTQILNTVADHKNIETIYAWHLANDIWMNFSSRHDFARAQLQRSRYFAWLKDLCDAIKKIDPNRALTKDISANFTANQQVDEIQRLNIKIDGYGLLVGDIQSLMEFMRQKRIDDRTCFISSIKPEQYISSHERLINQSIIIANWQNQWENQQISLDGLLDFNGNYKDDFAGLANIWNKTYETNVLPKIRIMRPALPLIANGTATYHALCWDGTKWIFPIGKESSHYSWMLIQLDIYGNTVSAKKLGTGSELHLTIPDNYTRYQLLLTLSKKGFSKIDQSTLNHPLYY